MAAHSTHDARRRQFRPRKQQATGFPFDKKYVSLLEALRDASKEQRIALLKTADRKLIKYICECALNVVRGVVSLKNSQLKKLRKHKQVLRKLAKKGSVKSWQAKKRVIVQKGGGFLPLLLEPVLSVLLSSIIQK